MRNSLKGKDETIRELNEVIDNASKKLKELKNKIDILEDKLSNLEELKIGLSKIAIENLEIKSKMLRIPPKDQEDTINVISSLKHYKVEYEILLLMFKKLTSEQEENKALLRSIEEDKGRRECSICIEDERRALHFRVQTTCGHYFHESCLKEWREVKDECPYCC